MHNSPQTKQRIIDIAMDLFEKKGFDKVSIKEICSELGYGRSAFYYHFRSKEQILMEHFKSENIYSTKTVSWILSGQNYVEKALRVQLACSKHLAIGESTNINHLLSYGISKGFTKGLFDISEIKNLLLPIVKEGQEKGEILNKLDANLICDTAISIQLGTLLTFVYGEEKFDFELELSKRLMTLYGVKHK